MKRARRTKDDSDDSSCSSTDGSGSSGEGPQFVRGDAQDQEGSGQGARRFGRPYSERASAVHSHAIPQTGVVPETVAVAPLSRESLNICAATDALLGGQVALGADIIVAAPIKSIEALGGGQSWAASQKLELTPLPVGRIGGEQGCKQTVARGVEEPAGYTEDLAEGRQRRLQEQAGGEQRERQEGERRRKGQTQRGTGERQVESPSQRMSEREIEAELHRIADMAYQSKEKESRGYEDDPSKLLQPNGSEIAYDHSSEAILAGTVLEEDAALDSKLSQCPLLERTRDLGAGGFRFVDIVGDLIGDLSPFLHKTLTKGEVFPLSWPRSVSSFNTPNSPFNNGRPCA